MPFGFLSPSLRGKTAQGRAGGSREWPHDWNGRAGVSVACFSVSATDRKWREGGRGRRKSRGKPIDRGHPLCATGQGRQKGVRQPAPAPAANEKAPPPSPALHWDATREERRIPLLGSALPPVLVHPTRGWKEQNKGGKRTGSSKSRHSLIRNPLRLRSPLSLVQTACPSSLT